MAAERSSSKIIVVYYLGKERALVAIVMSIRGARGRVHKSLANVTLRNNCIITSTVNCSLEYFPGL